MFPVAVSHGLGARERLNCMSSVSCHFNRLFVLTLKKIMIDIIVRYFQMLARIVKCKRRQRVRELIVHKGFILKLFSGIKPSILFISG